MRKKDKKKPSASKHFEKVRSRLEIDPAASKKMALENADHSIGILLTGIPLRNICESLATQGRSEKETADELIKIRKLGLTQKEIDAIPPRQIQALANFNDTLKLIDDVKRVIDRTFPPDTRPKEVIGTPGAGKIFIAQMIKKPTT